MPSKPWPFLLSPSQVLYPLLEKELRNKLLLEAKEHVLQSCLHRFRRWLDMAPMAIKKEEEEEEEECDGPFSRVVACAYSSDRCVCTHSAGRRWFVVKSGWKLPCLFSCRHVRYSK